MIGFILLASVFAIGLSLSLPKCKSINTLHTVSIWQDTGKRAVSLFSHSEMKITNDAPDKLNPIQLLPCGDKLDRLIIGLAIPAVVNFAIVPLVGAVDMFFIGKMNNALALAGSAAANQIFSSIYWTCTFLPFVLTPMVAVASASNDEEAVRSRVTDGFKIALVIGVIGTLGITLFADQLLGLVLPAASASRQFAIPYLQIRASTFLPAIMSTVGFAAFRGKMDVTTPLKISLLSNIVNIVLDPIFIFHLNMGVSGAALATSVSDFIGFCVYMDILNKRRIIKLSYFFKKSTDITIILKLLVGGFTLQLRSLLIEIVFISFSRAAQQLDLSGVTAAAHAIAMQMWSMTCVIVYALGGVGSILIPSKAAANGGDLSSVKPVADRLIMWGLFIGIFLGCVQLCLIPAAGLFSSIPAVQEAARIPILIGALLQFINGIVFIGEGIQQGTQDFGTLTRTVSLSFILTISTLQLFGKRSLPGVWASLGTFYIGRLLGVLKYYFVDGPFSGKQRIKTLFKKKHQGSDGRQEVF